MNMETTVKTITPNQRQYFLSQKTIFAWSKDTGLNYNSLHKFFNGTYFLRASNLDKLCDTAGISVSEFYRIAEEETKSLSVKTGSAHHRKSKK